MPQLNLAADVQEETDTNVGNTDRLLLWQSSVASTSDIRYVQFSVLKSKIISDITTPVGDAIKTTLIAKPESFGASVSTDSFLIYNVATGGSLNPWVASAKAPTNSVVTTSITDYNVTAIKLAASAVVQGKLAADAVVSANLSADCVTATKLAANAVTTTAITNAAVTNDKLAASGLSASKMTIGTLPVDQVPNLDVSKITTATGNALPIALGGTGAKTQSAALQNVLAYGGSDAATGRRIYIQSTIPTGTFATGDLWFQV